MQQSNKYLLLIDYRVYVAKCEIIDGKFAGDVNGSVNNNCSFV